MPLRADLVKRACTNLNHPVGKPDDTTPTVTNGLGLVYLPIMCPTCGREQGRRLVRGK